MAISLYTRSYGPASAGLTVMFRNPANNLPAMIYNSSSVLINDQGNAKLDSSGNLSVYVDTAINWNVNLISDIRAESDEAVPLSAAQKAAGAVSLYGATADGTLVAPDGTTVFGSAVKALVSAAGKSTTVVLFGDSHTRRNGPTLSSKASSAVGYELTDVVSGGAQVYFGGDGYFVAANTIMNWPFRILHNAAVGGETIAQINARIPSAMVKYQPRYAVYMAGTNDVQDVGITNSTTADTAAAAAISGIQAGWTAIRSYGATVLAYTLPPRTSLNGFQRRVWSQVNAWIRQNAGKDGVILAGDAAKAAGNPATGDWLTSGQYGAVASANSGDNIHGSDYGYYLIGCESAARMAPLIALKRQGLAAPELAYDATNGNNPLGNLLINGKLLGTAGTQTAPASGTVPDSWTVQATPTAPSGGTIVTSKVSRGIAADDATTVEEYGEWFQVSMTGGTTAGVLALQQETQALTGGGAWAIGDVVVASLQFETDAANWNQASVGASPPIVEIQFGPNGGVGLGGYRLNGAPSVQGRIPAGVARSPETAIPAGITRMFIRIVFRGQGTWRISNVDLRRVPDRTLSQV